MLQVLHVQELGVPKSTSMVRCCEMETVIARLMKLGAPKELGSSTFQLMHSLRFLLRPGRQAARIDLCQQQPRLSYYLCFSLRGCPMHLWTRRATMLSNTLPVQHKSHVFLALCRCEQLQLIRSTHVLEREVWTYAQLQDLCFMAALRSKIMNQGRCSLDSMSDEYSELRSAVLLLLRCRKNESLASFAMCCSSWVTVSRSSTGRSILTPMGGDYAKVKLANLMTSRSPGCPSSPTFTYDLTRSQGRTIVGRVIASAQACPSASTSSGGGRHVHRGAAAIESSFSS